MKVNSKLKKFYLITFIFLSLFICVESCLPSNISSFQSQLIAMIFNKGQRGDKEILPNSLTIEGNANMKIGESQQLTATLTPENVSDNRITWSIESTDTASISSSGVVSALKEGKVTIRATANADKNVFYDFTIHIDSVALESLIVHYDKNEVSVGTTASFSVQYEPGNTTNKGFEWVSDDENIATINGRGIVKGIQVGTCHIYAKSKYYDIESEKIEVTVNNLPVVPVTEITCADIEEPIYVSQSIDINPIFNENATDKSYYMKSSDSSVFSISNHRIIGRKEGSAYLTIVSNTDDNVKSREILVQVKEVNAVGIQLNQTYYVYQKPQRLNYSLISENANYAVTNQEVSISLKDNKICTLDSNGVLYAQEEGKVEVTITWKKNEAVSITQEIEFVLPSDSNWLKVNIFTRKFVGHFSAFMITGIFGALTLIAYADKLKYIYTLLINIGYGFMLGGASELLQLIPEGRACQFKDAMIDALGYAVGACLTILIVWIIKVIRIKKEKSKSTKE